MGIQVLMPGIGAGTTHGKIIQWLKQEGDAVAVGDLLAEIETDKAVIELEAMDAGVLKRIVIPAGDAEVEVGEVVAEIEAEGSAASSGGASSGSSGSADSNGPAGSAAAAPAASPSSGGKASPSIAAAAGAATGAGSRRYFASPSARRLAREHGIDIAELEGSGPNGRIVRIDVERRAEQAASASAGRAAGSTAASAPAVASTGAVQGAQHAAASAAGRSGATAAASTSAAASSAAMSTPESGAGKRVPHSAMRRTIARRLTEAKQQVPHFYLELDCRMEAFLDMRQKLNARPGATRVSVNDLVVLAVARALEQHPDMNVQWAPDAMVQLDTVDISVAVATDNGLFTPVVRDAGRKGAARIATELRGLIDKAHAGKLQPADYEGGSFTISNLGMLGISRFAAIINPPQAAILAVGAVDSRPVVENDALVVGKVMSMTLSVDHRAVDGATAAKFLATLKAMVEEPLNLVG